MFLTVPFTIFTALFILLAAPPILLVERLELPTRVLLFYCAYFFPVHVTYVERVPIIALQTHACINMELNFYINTAQQHSMFI